MGVGEGEKQIQSQGRRRGCSSLDELRGVSGSSQENTLPRPPPHTHMWDQMVFLSLSLCAVYSVSQYTAHYLSHCTLSLCLSLYSLSLSLSLSHVHFIFWRRGRERGRRREDGAGRAGHGLGRGGRGLGEGEGEIHEERERGREGGRGGCSSQLTHTHTSLLLSSPLFSSLSYMCVCWHSPIV